MDKVPYSLLFWPTLYNVVTFGCSWSAVEWTRTSIGRTMPSTRRTKLFRNLVALTAPGPTAPAKYSRLKTFP